MAKWVQLTDVADRKIMVNLDMATMIAPAMVGEADGSVIYFAHASGEKNSRQSVRVQNDFAVVTRSLR